MRKFLFAVAVVALPFLSSAADSLTLHAANKLSVARPNQTVEVTAQQLEGLGEKDLNKVHVKDASGKELISQAIDTDWDDYRKPDVLIFQSDFAAGETKTFTVTTGKAHDYQPSDYKVYGRFVRERFDDYAWENDLIAHRTYGKALETWKGEPLTSSSIDIWSKLNPTLVVNEWYMMGDAFYHHLNSNGADLYSAGTSRGDGATGVWAGDKLYVSKNFVESRTFTGGPIRVMFELDYPPYDVNGVQVTETRRISLDAGSQLDHYETKFHVAGPSVPTALQVAIGLKKVTGEQKEFDAAQGCLRSWQGVEKGNGMQGIAVVVSDEKSVDRQAEDKANNLVVLKPDAINQPVSYWAGFAWDKAGKVASADAWKKYVDEFAQKARSPVEVTVSQ